MQSDSETEPELDPPSEWEPFSLQGIQQSIFEQAPPQFRDDEHYQTAKMVEGAVLQLIRVDAEKVENDDKLQELLLRSSNVIVWYLEGLSANRVRDHPEDLEAFAHILQQIFMQKLFELRRVFHKIAARQSACRQQSAVIICWVDVLLAKFGDAVLVMMQIYAGLDERENVSEVFEIHRRQLSLHAALQLPERWISLPGIVSSDHASPAATRLALRLMFAVYVIGARISGCGDWPRDGITPEDVMLHLQHHLRCLSRAILSPDGELPSDDIRSEDRCTLAMLVALFSASDAALGKQSSPFRPLTLATLLALLKEIFPSTEPQTSQTVVYPVSCLDTPQAIILHGSDVIPWSWSMWTDDRVADIEVIDYITVSWFLHLHCEISKEDGSGYRGKRLLSGILQNPAATGQVLLRILGHVIASCSSTSATNMSPEVFHVIFRSVWAAIQIWTTAPLSIQPHAPELTRMTSCVFLLLGQSFEEIEVKDTILEFLSLAPGDMVRHGISRIHLDPQITLRLRLEDDISRFSRAISNNPQDSSKDLEDLGSLRQLLQFACLLLANDAGEYFQQQPFYSLLGELATWLSSRPVFLKGPYLESLLQPLVTLLSVFEYTKLYPRNTSNNDFWTDDLVWGWIAEEVPATLAAASTFAPYISVNASRRRYKPTRSLEAWDYFRDILLQILNHQYIDDEEPLALLASSDICLALCTILRFASPHVGRFIRASPWTGSLYMFLKKNRCESTPNQYSDILKRRLAPFAPHLMKLIEKSDVSGTLPHLPSSFDKGRPKLVFCQLWKTPQLLFLQG